MRRIRANEGLGVNMRWLVVLGVLGIVGILVALGPQRVAHAGYSRLRRGWHIVTGKLVDVGGYRLRVDRLGQGSPVVVMEAGLCQTRDTWGIVPEQVASFTQVVLYDRAGLGGSDPGPVPRSSQLMVEELHALLSRARIPAPYVLVGHSLGGLNVRLYASEYPEQVAGLVLIDASHEDAVSRIIACLPPEEQEARSRHEGGENCERVDVFACSDQVRDAQPLPDIPVVVLTAEQADWPVDWPVECLNRVHEELQLALATQMPSSRRVIVPCGHFVQLHQPQAVVDSIRYVVEQAR